MPDRILKRHDTAQQARVRFLDESGVPIDLTGATVTYTMTDVETGVLIINRATAGIPDQVAFPGEAYYQRVADDVATMRIGAEEWEVVYPNGSKETFPVGRMQIVRIEADADNT